MEIEYFDADVSTVFQELAGTLLNYASAIALLLLIWAGIYFMYSAGNPEAQKRAKNMVSYIILGLVIVVLSFAMIKAADKIMI